MRSVVNVSELRQPSKNIVMTLLVQLEPLVINPPIWRQLLVDGSITLRQLHHVIQAAMGWESAHMYEFAIGLSRYGQRLEGSAYDFDDDDEGVRLTDFAKKGYRFRYLYDFGDQWNHIVVIDAIEPCPDNVPVDVVKVLDGEGACPPEDVGGADGFNDMLKTLKKPGTPSYNELMDWLDGPYEPEIFDIRQANASIVRSRNNFLI